MSDEILEGGQGRSPADIRDSGNVIQTVMLMGCVVVLVAVIWRAWM
jgi:hypothetical protein